MSLQVGTAPLDLLLFMWADGERPHSPRFARTPYLPASASVPLNWIVGRTLSGICGWSHRSAEARPKARDRVE